MWLAKVVALSLFCSITPSPEAFKNCGQDKQCVPYEQCNEGSFVDGKFYPDRSRTTLDENCHYMEKCCNKQDTRGETNKQQEAKFGEFSWLTVIMSRKGSACSGVLITPVAVITTAYCVEEENPDDLRVVAGDWDDAELKPQWHQGRSVKEILLHPNYTQLPLVHNIAVVLVDQNSPFHLSPNVQPICLPPLKMVYNYSQCYMSGWQRSDFGVKAIWPERWTLYVLPPDQCRAKMRLIFGRRHFYNDSLLFAVGDKGDFVCGDVEMDGVPLMCPLPDRNDRFHLAGLLARPIRCDGTQSLGIFTNLQFYRQWIDLKLRERELDMGHYMV
ncbi:hypothetical protein KR038_001188 [Drosophila bunnanda]|nr:hypothetical protein KR038_001188 [Drosophila bunnanda]